MGQNMKSQPMISVVMPVYNVSKYLAEAIESILKQTFTDFEFIMIDDGSTDESWKIIKSFDDSRIISMKNSKNKGITYSLNKAVQLSSGEYIARMDGDDYSDPRRFELQLKLLKNHPKVGVLGCNLKTLVNGKRSFDSIYGKTHDEIKARMIFGSPVAHPTTIIKTKLLRKYQYEDGYEFSEDYNLWTKLVDITAFLNLDKSLVTYRISSTKNKDVIKAQQKSSLRIMINYLRRLGIEPSLFDTQSHCILAGYKKLSTKDEYEKLLNWSSIIIKKNSSSNYLNENILTKLLKERIRRIIQSSSLPIIIKSSWLIKSITLSYEN